jgi:hypothetical protein
LLERYAGSSTQLNGDRRQKSCVQNRRRSAKNYENYRKCLPARRKTPPSASNRQRFAIGSNWVCFVKRLPYKHVSISFEEQLFENCVFMLLLEAKLSRFAWRGLAYS